MAEFSGRTRGPALRAHEKRIFDSRQETEKVLLAGFYVDNYFIINAFGDIIPLRGNDLYYPVPVFLE